MVVPSRGGLSLVEVSAEQVASHGVPDVVSTDVDQVWKLVGTAERQ